MNIQRLSIPDRKLALDAADIVINTFREIGMCPAKAMLNPMARALALEWRDGRFTREQFIHACRNLLILNPSLALDGRIK